MPKLTLIVMLRFFIFFCSAGGEVEEKRLFSLSLTENKPGFDPQEAKLKEPHQFTPRDLLTLLR